MQTYKYIYIYAGIQVGCLARLIVLVAILAAVFGGELQSSGSFTGGLLVADVGGLGIFKLRMQGV